MLIKLNYKVFKFLIYIIIISSCSSSITTVLTILIFMVVVFFFLCFQTLNHRAFLLVQNRRGTSLLLQTFIKYTLQNFQDIWHVAYIYAAEQNIFKLQLYNGYGLKVHTKI